MLAVNKQIIFLKERFDFFIVYRCNEIFYVDNSTFVKEKSTGISQVKWGKKSVGWW